MTVTTYSDARARLASLCDLAASTREPVIITRRSAEDVALVSAAELSSLLETAHLLRSPENARREMRIIDFERDDVGPAIEEHLAARQEREG